MRTVSFTENEIEYIKELYIQELEKLEKRTNIVAALLKKLDQLEGSKENEEIQPKRASKKIEKTERASKQENGQLNNVKELENEIDAILNTPKRRGRKPGTSKAVEELATPKNGKTGPKAVEKVNSEKKIKAAKVLKTAKKTEKTEEKGKPGRKKSADSKRAILSASILDKIKDLGKVIPSSVIVEDIMKADKIPASDIIKTRSLVGGSLIDLKKEGKIKTLPNPGKKGELYGLAQWFDAKGNLVDESKR